MLSAVGLLAAVLLTAAPPSAAAQPSKGKQAPMTQEQAETILEELRGIRRLLERMEEQGRTAAPQRAQSAAVRVSVKDRPALGAAQAPVTVVEFSDYQCPFCKRFVENAFPLLNERYVKTGKVRWVVRDLPLGFHPHARKAAQAAHCAGEQGKFWEMRDVLFRNDNRLAEDQLPAYAQETRLDTTAFKECLASGRHFARIDQDVQDAGNVRITGTPTFVIGRSEGEAVNGHPVVGAQAAAVFEAEIQRLLQGNAPARDEAGGARPSP
ncbi:MAG TPA: DsbA family protein [Acidiferrobacterales bacterium]